MRVLYTERFSKSYRDALPAIQRALDRRIALLIANLRHPSLRAKKYDERRNIWQARVNEDWRFYFCIDEDAYVLLDMIAHPK